jgi:hypothetical protein
MQCLTLRATAAAPPRDSRTAQPAHTSRPALQRCARTVSHSQHSAAAGAAAPIELDEERQKMYQPKFAGEGAPEWNAATCTASDLVLPDTRVVTLDVRF